MPQPSLPCARCEKPAELCVCDLIRPLKTRTHVLILQHPQEPDKELGSARIAHLALPNSSLKVGLSWPNLKTALGREALASRWAVLYLGSGVKQHGTGHPNSFQLVDKKGTPVPLAGKQDLEGIILLDGTWSQAKTLWWRNAWLLKLRRAILTPERKSLYRELRKEPRRECLSTIESIAECMDALGEDPATGTVLREVFEGLLEKKRKRKNV